MIRRRDHTFQAPVPENTAQFGVPNACTTCHDNRSPEWAAKQMTEWWGDGERRAKAASLADTMYRAGSGDATTLPALARLAVDRSQGLLVRASAAEYIAQLISGAQQPQRGAEPDIIRRRHDAERRGGRETRPARRRRSRRRS